MKKKIIAFLFILCMVPQVYLSVNATQEDVSAKAAVLLDAETGLVLYEKNSQERLPMASTTKVMTALLTLEFIEAYCDETVTVTKEMVMVEGSSMGLRAGDRIPLSALVVGMLLPSGNDAANAAALHISKTQTRFADAMNLKAEQLGMQNTHFVTPSGLDDTAHYSTAYDMALLTAAAMKNTTFAKIFGSEKTTVAYNAEKTKATFRNHNKLLRLAEDCVGGKTGFTKKSGRCLVSAAEKWGCTVIAVTLNAPDDWNDHISLYALGFAGLKTATFPEEKIRIPDTQNRTLIVKVYPSEKNYLSGTAPKRILLLPKFIYAGAYQKGDILGQVRYQTEVGLTQSLPIFY